jgi:hypothetical protein
MRATDHKSPALFTLEEIENLRIPPLDLLGLGNGRLDFQQAFQFSLCQYFGHGSPPKRLYPKKSVKSTLD